jgi:hypothetical protein
MKRRGALVGFVIVLALGAAACGGGGNSNAAVSIETLQAAASNSQAAESSRFTMDMKVDALGDTVAIRADGVMSGDGKNGQITVSMPIVGSIEERIVDGVIYMDLGSFPGAPDDVAGKWVKLDPEKLKDDPRFGATFSQLADQAESSSPKQGLEYLQGLSGDVQDLGQEDVNGQPATHYRASIDYSKLVDQLPDVTDEMREQFAQLGTVPADIWIDGQDRVVKMHMTMDGASFGGGAGTVDMTMEMTEFGVPVDVQAPPDDQVMDFSELTSLDI